MILYIITWTCIYTSLLFLLHNLYLFFQNNLTTTKNRDYYNSIPIEPIKECIEANIEKANIEKANIEQSINISKEYNTDFTCQMKYELNDFIKNIK